MFKVIIFKYNQRLSPILDLQTADTILWQGAHGNGYIQNRMLDTLATNRVKILYQTIVKPTPFNQIQGPGDGPGTEHSNNHPPPPHKLRH